MAECHQQQQTHLHYVMHFIGMSHVNIILETIITTISNRCYSIFQYFNFSNNSVYLCASDKVKRKLVSN